MGCFSLQWIGHLLVWLIVVIAVVTIVRILVPWLLSLAGGIPAPIMAIINVILWAIIAIAVVWIVVDLLSCLTGGGSGLSLMPPRH